MALIGNNADTLLNGLSSFWHRFFRDTRDIQAAYEGTEILLGQVYLNFMSDVLNTSIVETPLFRKEYYRLITVRSDNVRFLERDAASSAPPALPLFYGNSSENRYVVKLDTSYGYIPSLQNQVYAPTASLEQGADYTVKENELLFRVDPTEPPLNGYATRDLDVKIGGKFYSATVPDWEVAGVVKGDVLYYSETTDLGTEPPVDQNSTAFAAWLSLQRAARMAVIVDVDGPMLSVAADTAIPSFPVGAEPPGFSWRIVRNRADGTYNTSLPRASSLTDGKADYTQTLKVTEISFWAVDARVDDKAIYRTYGYFFTDERTSTETYRSLIRGMMQLYVYGPAMARLESALNLTAGLPTILSDGEVLQNFDNGISDSGVTGTLLVDNVFDAGKDAFNAQAVGGYLYITNSDYPENIGVYSVQQYISSSQVKLQSTWLSYPDNNLQWQYSRTNAQTVTTSANTYEYPLSIPIRQDVQDPTNYGTLTFQTFEPLTTAIQVTDYVQDPQWWHSITIPLELAPNKSLSWRTVTPTLYPNTIGTLGQAEIGDPGFYVGADEELNIVSRPYRHKASFILMDRFLKMHLFAVVADPAIRLTGLLVGDLKKILDDVKPVHTGLYFSPLTALADYINTTEILDVRQTLRKVTDVNVLNNELRVGSAWIIGDAWKYASPAGGATLTAFNDGINDGIYAVIGGLDPVLTPSDVTLVPPSSGSDLQVVSRPLYVHTRA